MDAAAQYAFAYALTTTAGVRSLLALAAVAVAAHVHWMHPPAGFVWLGSATAMWILIGVAVVELLADKVPVLDHAVHFVQIAGKPAAGAILVGGSVHAQSHELLIGLMVLGALNALGIHAAIASVRGASTMTTGGAGNPFVSVVEDAGAIGSLIIAFVAPFAAALLAVAFTIALILLARAAYHRMRAARAPT
ncbi:MAG: DUF4126 domain-containing protein [Candidatus Eremiobacteraeota bacterium]|nr:DUF4126 domain-containing protein [Candidatus Eremiobacteraeota bacterium]